MCFVMEIVSPTHGIFPDSTKSPCFATGLHEVLAAALHSFHPGFYGPVAMNSRLAKKTDISSIAGAFILFDFVSGIQREISQMPSTSHRSLGPQSSPMCWALRSKHDGSTFLLRQCRLTVALVTVLNGLRIKHVHNFQQKP